MFKLYVCFHKMILRVTARKRKKDGSFQKIFFLFKANTNLVFVLLPLFSNIILFKINLQMLLLFMHLFHVWKAETKERHYVLVFNRDWSFLCCRKILRFDFLHSFKVCPHCPVFSLLNNFGTTTFWCDHFSQK